MPPAATQCTAALTNETELYRYAGMFDWADGSIDGTYTLAELRQMDFGSWFGPEFAGAQVVTLDSLPLVVDKVLVHGALEIFDSTQIFEWLEDLQPEPPLWPRDRV